MDPCGSTVHPAAGPQALTDHDPPEEDHLARRADQRTKRIRLRRYRFLLTRRTEHLEGAPPSNIPGVPSSDTVPASSSRGPSKVTKRIALRHENRLP